ncbi:hypothetical protein HN803_07415 [candidate division WWE3 bacterium]|jgi:hypothetical protein|nr:hypothetical protein [Candidatus Scalindua sp.]MBT7350581.1 hypothetical protein [candidate division WWE3 bacterium]
MILSYRYSGVKKDGTHEVIADNFKSKGIAFINASQSATHLRCNSNPRRYIRLEIQDDSGEPVDDYKDHAWLKCNTE